MSREVLPAILLELLAIAGRSGQPASRVLKKGLSLRARVYEGRREVLAFRDPGGAERLEADIVRRALEFPCADPVAFSAKRGAVNGWLVAELLPDEVKAKKLEVASRNADRITARLADRVEYAVQLKLKLYPQHPDSMEIVDCWREGFEQLGDAGLEKRILELEQELKGRKGDDNGKI